MSVSSILLGLTLLILVVPFVAEPFLRRPGQGRKLKTASAPIGEAVTKEAALLALRDLDFDFHTGKITEVDYAPLRQQLLGVAAQAAQQERGRTGAGRAGPADIAEDDAIEQAVRARRQARVARRDSSRDGLAHSGSDDVIEAAVRSLRRSSPPAAGPVCPECGSPAQPGDHFCHNCGAAMGLACPACQSPISANDQFCGRCGAELLENVVTDS
jgi:hypothetical protein